MYSHQSFVIVIIPICMLHYLLATFITGYRNFTSGKSILSGYSVLRGPVSLIVNTEVRVGNTNLQICKKLP